MHLTVGVVLASPSAVRACDVLLRAVSMCWRPFREHYREITKQGAGGVSFLVRFPRTRAVGICVFEPKGLFVNFLYLSFYNTRGVDPGVSGMAHTPSLVNKRSTAILLPETTLSPQNNPYARMVYFGMTYSATLQSPLALVYAFLRFLSSGNKILRKNNGIYTFLSSLSMVLNYASCICPLIPIITQCGKNCLQYFHERNQVN